MNNLEPSSVCPAPHVMAKELEACAPNFRLRRLGCRVRVFLSVLLPHRLKRVVARRSPEQGCRTREAEGCTEDFGYNTSVFAGCLL